MKEDDQQGNTVPVESKSSDDDDEDKVEEDNGDEDEVPNFPHHVYALFVRDSNDLYEEDPEPEVQGLTLTKGMEFASAKAYRLHLKTYAIVEKFVIVSSKSESYMIRSKCEVEDCKWECNARRLPHQQAWSIWKLVPEHTCQGNQKDRHPMVNARWVADVLDQDFRDHQNSWSPEDFQIRVWRKYQAKISYQTAWRARNKILVRIFGSFDKSYALIPEFSQQGKYGRVLLAATALDARNGLFPLAIYICRSENLENWIKFLEALDPHILKHRRRITFISDRQKGLLSVVRKRGLTKRVISSYRQSRLRSKT
ncbi:hypothetical protein BVC80_1601g2 [Macleaya cordata]|uniref:Transposase MuDR plant domain-containing protein n=1 Tax=Macleaya cordata TaxID=56857 RepID=A0A200Q9Y6_MACCD|nr:hypothetical protein BVC80_1601g2 [Macleaya cordata]